jgi:hypothetical protein
MKHSLDNVKTFSIPDDHLHGSVVLAGSLLYLEQVLDEIRQERQALARLVECQLQILKAFGDLYLEMNELKEHRQWLSKQIAMAERSAARLRLPAWFWRIDPTLDLQSQLTHRAKLMLQESRATLDDTWDVLTDVLRFGNLEPDETMIRTAIKGAQQDASS